uniref:Calcyphosine 2 n=1 Tax=Lepisosteus oculatus TaxID=7918 RepID=W5NHD9_LEPOC
MVDQLSRAVISDPDQNSTSNEQISVQRPGSAPLRFKNRALHDTKVRTRSALTENLLSNKLRFDARILTRSGRDACRELIGFFFAFDKSLTIYEYRHFGKNRSSALPLIQKGSYSHQHGRRKGVQFGIHDFYVKGANLTFTTTGHNLPENIKQKPLLTLRITDVDEMAKSMLLASVEDIYQDPTKQEVDDRNTLFSIQGTLKEKLKKRGVRTLTGIGKLFRSLDKSGDGVLQKEQVQLALKEFHLTLSEKDFDAVWRIMDLNCDGEVDYGEFLRAVTGEMNEYRKAFVRKTYQWKIAIEHTSSVYIFSFKDFHCSVIHYIDPGEATEDQLRAGFVETLREACTNRNDVSYCEFEDYYEGLSIGISEDEDFANILKNSWGI